MTLTVQMRSFFLINQMSSTSKLSSSFFLASDDFCQVKLRISDTFCRKIRFLKKKICFCYFVRKTESVTEMTFSGTNLLFYNMVYYIITPLESLRHAPKKIVKTQHLISANNFTIFRLIFVVNSKLRRMQNLSQILEPQVFKLFFPSFSKEMSCLSCMIHCLLSCIMSFLKETFLQLLHLAKQIANGPIKTLQSFQNWV